MEEVEDPRVPLDKVHSRIHNLEVAVMEVQSDMNIDWEKWKELS